MSGTTRSPLASLVLFTVCLSIAGTCIAGVHYYAVDLPQQNLQAPSNSLMTCSQYCDAQYYSCIPYCKRYTDINSLASCRSNCEAEYTACKAAC